MAPQPNWPAYSDLENLLTHAEAGIRTECEGCILNPSLWGELVPFGKSCTFKDRTSGLGCSDPVSEATRSEAVTMLIAQDPGGTTPGKPGPNYGRLCFKHNSESAGDKTAEHAYDLWASAVAFSWDARRDRFLDRHYWTNATMHGAPRLLGDLLRNQAVKKTLEDKLANAQMRCARILKAQIDLIKPAVIISCGEQPMKALKEVGYHSRSWTQCRTDLDVAVDSYTLKFNAVDVPTKVFATYHTSARAVNVHVAPRYTEKTERLLASKMNKAAIRRSCMPFLEKYRPSSTEGKGMRVLLLHWLEIGEEIRRCHGGGWRDAIDADTPTIDNDSDNAI